MTVKELIEKLEKMPPDAEVIYYDGDNGWCAPNVEYKTKYIKFMYTPTVEYVHGHFVDLTSDC